jgi:hypothetical protein
MCSTGLAWCPRSAAGPRSSECTTAQPCWTAQPGLNICTVWPEHITAGRNSASTYPAGSEADTMPPRHRWIDPLAALAYQHWGNWTDDEGLPEPNNLYGGEFCGAANATERHGGAYGWADVSCNRPGAFMCKIIREWPMLKHALPGQISSLQQQPGNPRHMPWTVRLPLLPVLALPCPAACNST